MTNAVVIAGGILHPEDPLFGLIPEQAPKNKVFLPLEGRRVLQWVLDALAGTERVEQIIIAGRSAEEGWTSAKPFLTSASICFGSSLRGLSDVAIVISDPCAATFAITGRLLRSRSPPQPKMVRILPGERACMASITRLRASPVWA